MERSQGEFGRRPRRHVALIVALGIVVGAALVAGCGKDKGSNPTPVSMFGTWKVTSAKVGIGSNMIELSPDMSTVGETYIFNADSTGTWKSKDNLTTSVFTYKVRNDSLIMTYDLMFSSCAWEQSGNTMYFRESESFTNMTTQQTLTKQ